MLLNGGCEATADMTMNDPPPFLQDLAQRHAVRYQVWPHEELLHDQRVLCGFDLELSGSHAGARTRLSPGCRRCTETYDALCALATWALNGEHDGSPAQIGPFDGALHMSTQGEPVVVLTIVIRDGVGPPTPIHDNQRRTLNAMQGALEGLGVRRSR